MANFLVTKEVNALKSEIEQSQNTLISSQITLANKLRNGLGEDIKKTLKTPQKPHKIRGFKYKVRRFFSGLKEKIKLMFINDNDEFYYSKK